MKDSSENNGVMEFQDIDAKSNEQESIEIIDKS
jgi:hypothetical protein